HGLSPGSPAPPAGFPPVTITRSTRRSRGMAGRSAATAWRPGFPTTSPTKRILTPRSARERVQLIDGGVVDGDLCIDVVRDRVVPVHEPDVRVVDVGRQLQRGVLRDDR